MLLHKYCMTEKASFNRHGAVSSYGTSSDPEWLFSASEMSEVEVYYVTL